MRQYDVTNYGMPQMASPAQIERERKAALDRLQAIEDRHEAERAAFRKAEADALEAALRARFMEIPGATATAWALNRERLIADHVMTLAGQADKVERERIAMLNSPAYNRF